MIESYLILLHFMGPTSADEQSREDYSAGAL